MSSVMRWFRPNDNSYEFWQRVMDTTVRIREWKGDQFYPDAALYAALKASDLREAQLSVAEHALLSRRKPGSSWDGSIA